MNLRIVLLFLVHLFCVLVCASAPTLTLDTAANEHRIRNSFFTTIINSFFSLPRVEEAFYANYESYENSHPIAASIAQVLAQMRESGRGVELSKYFDDTFLQRISDDKVLIEDLFQMLCESFPPSIKSLFDLRVTTSFIKDKFCVPLSKVIIGLKLYTRPDGGGLFDEFNVCVPGTEMTRTRDVRREITENSKILVFYPERAILMERNYHFNVKPVVIEPKFSLNGQEYELKTSIKFDVRSSIAETVINDSAAPFEDQLSMLLFYGRKEEEEERVAICVPESLKSVCKKRRRDSEINFEISVQRKPDLRDFIEKNRYRLSEDSIEMLYKYSCTDTSSLGTEEYAFLTGPNGIAYGALELVLSILASNKNLVFKLFEDLRRETSDSFNFQLGLVIFRMLLGSKSISLNNLVASLAEKAGLSVVYFENTSSGPKVSDQIKIIVSLLDPTLIDAPKVKLVEYTSLESDDPHEIRITQVHEGIRPSSLIPPRPADIRGMWCDTCDEIGGQSKRIRRIHSSPMSQVISIEIDRFFSDKESGKVMFDNKPVKVFGTEYKICGSIGISVSDGARRTVAISFNEFTGKFCEFTPGSPSKQITLCKQFIDDLTQRFSFHNFYKKTVPNEVKPYLITQVPTRISATTFSFIMQECGHKNRFHINNGVKT